MDSQDRFKERLSSYTGASTYPQVLMVCGQLSHLPVSGPSLCPFNSAPGIYQDPGTHSSAPALLEYSHPFISQPLDPSGQFSTASSGSCPENCTATAVTGVDSKLGQMSLTTNRFPGTTLRSSSISGFHLRNLSMRMSIFCVGFIFQGSPCQHGKFHRS